MVFSLFALNQQSIYFKNVDHLASDFSRVFQALSRHGYSIVQMWDASEESLSQLWQRLGRVQLHVRSNDAGVVAVCPKTSPWQSKIDTVQYLGIQTLEHFPHTDGAYLKGFVEQSGHSQWVAPPAYVLLQCVKQSSVGGESIIIDGQAILEDLLRKAPHIARVLYEPGCVSFCRDDQLACQVAIYERLSAGRYRFRFRYDKALFVGSEDVRDALYHLYDHYLMNDEYRISLRLEPGQVLIVDNLRMLHGRTSFDDAVDQERFLRRVWIADDTLPTAPTSFVDNPDPSCRAFTRFEKYVRLEKSSLEPQPLLNPGIYLPGNLEGILHRPVLESIPVAC
ncbi:MAG: TauD/TfdA family dioxygenase [Cyanobacteria bacterium J06554_1]